MSSGLVEGIRSYRTRPPDCRIAVGGTDIIDNFHVDRRAISGAGSVGCLPPRALDEHIGGPAEIEEDPGFCKKARALEDGIFPGMCCEAVDAIPDRVVAQAITTACDATPVVDSPRIFHVVQYRHTAELAGPESVATRKSCMIAVTKKVLGKVMSACAAGGTSNHRTVPGAPATCNVAVSMLMRYSPRGYRRAETRMFLAATFELTL
jgi:hypothetical protein